MSKWIVVIDGNWFPYCICIVVKYFIIVKGFLIPSKSNIVFEEFIIDKIKLSDKKIKEYEIKFKKEIVRGSLNNIFNENKINKYFSSLF